MQIKKERFSKGILTRDLGAYLKSIQHSNLSRHKYLSNSIATNKDKYLLLISHNEYKSIKNKRDIYFNLFKNYKKEISLINYLHNDKRHFSNKIFIKNKNFTSDKKLPYYSSLVSPLAPKIIRNRSFKVESNLKLLLDLFGNQLENKKYKNRKVIKKIILLYYLFCNNLNFFNMPNFLKLRLKTYFVNKLAKRIYKHFSWRKSFLLNKLKKRNTPYIKYSKGHRIFNTLRRLKRIIKKKDNIKTFDLNKLKVYTLDQIVLKLCLKQSPKFKLSGKILDVKKLLYRYQTHKSKNIKLSYNKQSRNIFKRELKKRKFSKYSIKKNIKRFLLGFKEYSRVFYYKKNLQRIAKSLKQNRALLLEIYFNLTKINEYLISTFKQPELVLNFYIHIINNFFSLPETETIYPSDKFNKVLTVKQVKSTKKPTIQKKNKEVIIFKRFLANKGPRLLWDPQSWAPKFPNTRQVKESLN